MQMFALLVHGQQAPLVTFAEYRLFYRSLLQKRPVIVHAQQAPLAPFAEYRLFYRSLLQKRPVIVHAQQAPLVTMGWLRVVGALQLYITFAEYRLFYRSLLQKRPVIVHVQQAPLVTLHDYGVATSSRLLKIIGFFCRISSLVQVSFTKKTCNCKEPTSRSHPITRIQVRRWSLVMRNYCSTCVFR